jgi:hypothetical protein
MNSRDARMAAVCAAGLLGTCMLNPVSAETIAVPNGIAVRDSSVPTPTRGMTMDEVAGKFGAPAAKIPAVGHPPISRWEYPGFVVYFEYQHVIHSVVANS